MSDSVEQGMAAYDRLAAVIRPTELAAAGERVAVTRFVDDKAQLVVVNTATGAQQVAIDGPSAVSSPRWSPDGHTLWCTTASADELDTVTAVGPNGAVRNAATLPGAIEDVWPRSDGSVVALVADPGSQRDGMHLALRVADPHNPRVDVPGDRRRRLVVIASDGTVRWLGSGGWSLWQADVRDDLAVAVASADPRPAGYYRPVLLALDLADDTAKVVLESDAQFARPRIDETGRVVQVAEGRSIVSGVLRRVDLDTGSARTLSGLDDVTDHGWLPGGKAWFVGWAGTGVHGGTLDEHEVVATPWRDIARLTGADAQPALSVVSDPHANAGAGTPVAYALRDASDFAPELVRYDLHTGAYASVTRWNSSAPVTSRQRTVRWHGADGAPVEGVLMLPPDTSDTPLPLVVLLHGGPTWLWSSSYSPEEAHEVAVPLVAAGAAVLLPNPRGSSGRGQAWAAAIVDDFGGADAADVAAGVEAMVADGIADPGRVGVAGLSYGGYLSAWCAATAHHFRAAVVMSGVADWQSFATTSAIAGVDGGYDRTYLPSADWRTAEGRARLADHSPVYRIDPTTAPTLILHGEADLVTPIGQAEQLLAALRTAGVDSTLAAYPGEGHELTDPGLRRDAVRRTLEWMHRHGVLTKPGGAI